MAEVSGVEVVQSFLVAAILGAFIFFVYQFVAKKSFYDKSFNMSLPILSVIVCAVVLTIQFNIVVSLGMVGALSIVRFRTAVKSPMDLVFLFWAIAVGIICGASVYIIAVVMSAAITVGLFVMEICPIAKAPVLLIVNASEKNSMVTIEQIVGKHSKRYHVKSQTINTDSLSLIIEVAVKDGNVLLSELAQVPAVKRCSLVSHDGEITF